MKRIFFLLFISTFSNYLTAQNSSNNLRGSKQSIGDVGLDVKKHIWSQSRLTVGTATKQKIDFDAIYNWPCLEDNDKDLCISSDGKFIAYNVMKGGLYKYKRHDSFIVQETDGPWKVSLSKVESGFFSGDGKVYIFRRNDSLGFLKLGETKIKYTTGVVSFDYSIKSKPKWMAYQQGKNGSLILQNLFTGEEWNYDNISNYVLFWTGDWLICQKKNHELILRNLNTNEEKTFEDVAEYNMQLEGKAMLVKRQISQTNIGQGATIQYVNLLDNSITTICSAPQYDYQIANSSFDQSGDQVTFLGSDVATKHEVNSILYYKKGMDEAVDQLSNPALLPDKHLEIKSTTFSANGNYIQFTVERTMQKSIFPAKGSVKINVWNYKDLIMRSEQLINERKPQVYTGVIDIDKGSIAFLESDVERIGSSSSDFLILYKQSTADKTDRFWETKSTRDSNYLFNLKDGSRVPLKVRTSSRDYSTDVFFSPDGKYLIYFDEERYGNYFSYDLQSHRLTKISGNIPAWQLVYGSPNRIGKEKYIRRTGLVGWQTDDKALLVSDNFDVWKLDYSGKRMPVNITNGYFRHKHIRLDGQNIVYEFSNGATLLLQGLNTTSERLGIYRITLGTVKDPEVLKEGNFRLQYMPVTTDPEVDFDVKGIKATGKKVWVVKKESPTEAPNYFLTANFKSYRQITDINPQRHFDWYATELHTFKCLDGRSGQGVLYRPQNFDALKKYSLLVVFYDQITDHLNKFQQPDYIWSGVAAAFNPAWIVGNDYLIFVPAMKNGPLKHGSIAFNIIEGAIKYLKTLPYVDENHIAGSAHSGSAKLGAYTFTHSKSFAAMCISEGFLYANMLSAALSIWSLQETGLLNLQSVEEDFEFGNLWKNKQSWLDQTTTINVDKAASPLLLYCGKKSSAEYKNQTLQFFTSLRRLEKKAWWLQYEEGGHILDSLRDLKDFTIRYTQYFDHYLKNAPGPKWMTQSMPNELDGIDSYLELDPSGTCAYSRKSECIICDAWNKQFKRNPAMFDKEIKDWVLDQDITEELNKKQKAERARLDKEGLIEQKKVVNILKYGYPEDSKTALKK